MRSHRMRHPTLTTYDFKCASCGAEWTEVELKPKGKCACGARQKPHREWNREDDLAKCKERRSAGLKLFKPMWFEHLGPEPVWVDSRRQLREECKRRGVEAVQLM